MTPESIPVESAGIVKSATAIGASAAVGVVGRTPPGNHCTNKDSVRIDTVAKTKPSSINIKDLMARGHWSRHSVTSRDSELKLKAANKHIGDISAKKPLSLSNEVRCSQKRRKTCSMLSWFRGSRA